MVSLLDSNLFGPWAGPLCCVLGQYHKLSVSVSTQVCYWIPANSKGNLTKCSQMTCD